MPFLLHNQQRQSTEGICSNMLHICSTAMLSDNSSWPVFVCKMWHVCRFVCTTAASDGPRSSPVSISIDNKFTATSSHEFSFVVSYCHFNFCLWSHAVWLLHFTWGIAEAKCILATAICVPVCVSVCLSLATFPHYGMDPDVTWGNGPGCPLVAHYWADFQWCMGFVAMTTHTNHTEHEISASACTHSVAGYL